MTTTKFSPTQQRGLNGFLGLVQVAVNPRPLAMTIPVSETTNAYFADLAARASKTTTEAAGTPKSITPENAAAIWIEQQIKDITKRVAAGEKPLP